MKKNFFLLIGIVFLFSSCGIHSGLTTNLNNHSTEVLLSKKNFKVTESVQGKSRATYVLIIGNLSKKAKIAEARANMLAKANIIGSSKAIINEIVEIKNRFYLWPILQTSEITVSAHIVEFTE